MNSARLLRAVLAVIIIYVPYQRHFPFVIDVKGLNLLNILFLFALLLIWKRKTQNRLLGGRSSPTPLKRQLLFFLACVFFAFIIGQIYDSSSFDDDLTALKTRLFYPLLFFLFFHAVDNLKTLRFCFGMILFVTFLVSLQSFRQALDYGILTFVESRRASGPFANDYRGANYAAAFLVIFVPLFSSVFLICKSRPILRLVAFGCVLLGVAAAFFTYSRQSYFILAAQFLVQTARRSVALVLVIAIGLVSYETWVPASVSERISMTEQVDASGDEALDTSTASRFIIWGGAAQLIAERPWGLGLNHFQREIGRFAPDYRGFDAHNAYVLVTTEMGLIGLVSLLLLLFALFRLAQRVAVISASEEAKLYGEGFLVSVIGFALCNVFGSRLFDGLITGDFWILAGLVARFHNLELERQRLLILDRPT